MFSGHVIIPNHVPYTHMCMFYIKTYFFGFITNTSNLWQQKWDWYYGYSFVTPSLLLLLRLIKMYSIVFLLTALF